MKIYTVLIHDWEENEHYIAGTYTTRALASKAMDGIMADVYGLNEFTDWDLNDFEGNWQYFYDGFTVEIQQTRLDDNTDL